LKLIAIEKDKAGRPVAQVDISPEEIAAIKKAVNNHPKYGDSDAEGMRMLGLIQRQRWNKLPNITIRDIKEVINKYIQDTGENSLFTTLNDETHKVWKQLNPS
jgi:hypothetical protein